MRVSAPTRLFAADLGRERAHRSASSRRPAASARMPFPPRAAASSGSPPARAHAAAPSPLRPSHASTSARAAGASGEARRSGWPSRRVCASSLGFTASTSCIRSSDYPCIEPALGAVELLKEDLRVSQRLGREHPPDPRSGDEPDYEPGQGEGEGADPRAVPSLARAGRAGGRFAGCLEKRSDQRLSCSNTHRRCAYSDDRTDLSDEDVSFPSTEDRTDRNTSSKIVMCTTLRRVESRYRSLVTRPVERDRNRVPTISFTFRPNIFLNIRFGARGPHGTH